MAKCYLAGPMRSKPQFNYPAFMAAASALRAKGWSVYNPAEMDIAHDDHNQSFMYMTRAQQEAHAGHPATARRYALRDTRCIIGVLRAEDGDAVVVLPDWQDSIGAKAEVAVARWCCLRVLTLEEALR